MPSTGDQSITFVALSPEMWEVQTPLTFTLVCVRRADGGLRITSPEVSGLILSGSDCRAVLRDVAPAIDGLTRHNAKR